MFLFSSFKKNIDSLIAAVIGFFIIFLFTRHGGVGVCPDGVVYLTVAENLHTNGSLTDFNHGVLIDFPAFYPVFLSSLIFITGLNPLLYAPILNAFLFAIIIYLSGYIMEQFSQKSTWYKRAVLTCIVISPALLEVYSMVWSETVFILLLMLFIIAMHRYFKSYSRSILIAAAGIASIAWVTRYAGIAIVGAGGLLLLLDLKMPKRKKLTDLLIYTAISPLLFIINAVRNYTLSGTITGNREISTTPLKQSLHDAGTVFFDWLPFLHSHYSGAPWAVALLLAGLALVCVKQLTLYKRLATYENIAPAFTLSYILFMVVTSSISKFETLNSRFFSPVFILLIWSCTSWIIPFLKNTTHSKKKWVLAFGIIIFLLFQYGQLAADYETWDGVKDAGIPGYTEDQWRYSEVVLFVQKDSLPFKKGYTIYSNANDAVYFFTGRQGKFLPHKQYKPGLTQFLNDDHCYVVWFNDGENPDLVDKAFLTKTKKMKLDKEFTDGAIYEYEK